MKNGLTHLDWTPDTRDTKCVLKWVLVRSAAFCCAHRPQIWIPETEYCQKVSSHAHIWPQGAEELLSGWVYSVKTITAPAPPDQIRSEQSTRAAGAELVNCSSFSWRSDQSRARVELVNSKGGDIEDNVWKQNIWLKVFLVSIVFISMFYVKVDRK